MIRASLIEDTIIRQSLCRWCLILLHFKGGVCVCVCVWLKSLKNEFFTRFKPLFSSQNKRKDQRSLKRNSIKLGEARREKNPLECYESHVWYLLKQSPLHITQNVKISCQLMIFILFSIWSKTTVTWCEAARQAPAPPPLRPSLPSRTRLVTGKVPRGAEDPPHYIILSSFSVSWCWLSDSLLGMTYILW